MAELRRAFEAAGGSDNMPGTQNRPRFVTNPHGTGLYCQEPHRDVFVEVRYTPRDDGTPFLMSYSVRRGAALHSSLADVNVAEAMQKGWMEPYNQRRTNAVIIVEDIRQRAPRIADLVEIGPE